MITDEVSALLALRCGELTSYYLFSCAVDCVLARAYSNSSCYVFRLFSGILILEKLFICVVYVEARR